MTAAEATDNQNDGSGTREDRLVVTSMTVYSQPVANNRDGFTVAEDGEYFYDVIKMLFNQRLVMTPKEYMLGWDYGWCYDDALTVLACLHVWDPQTQSEPLGWKKRATHVVRTAPRAETDPEYNRPRCAHGHYRTSGPCKTDRFCGVHESIDPDVS